MKPHLWTALIFLSATAFFTRPVFAQSHTSGWSTPAVTLEEKEALYSATVEDRTLKIMQALALTDSAASNRVHDAIVAHYRALRARDEAIEAELGNMSKGSAEWMAQRVAMFPGMSRPLHERFIATLAKDLTPEQVETVKDKLTYGKVQFTYDAYCLILPQLTAADKAKIMELLKAAREVAMDGGSSGEKSAIFQEYKAQINAYLRSQGIDAAKAIQDWNDHQKLADKQTGTAAATAK